jgi:hypothetical protein
MSAEGRMDVPTASVSGLLDAERFANASRLLSVTPPR